MILPFSPIHVGEPVDPNNLGHIKLPTPLDLNIPMKREGDDEGEVEEGEIEELVEEFEDEDAGPTFPEDYKRHQARALRRRYPRRLEESSH